MLVLYHGVRQHVVQLKSRHGTRRPQSARLHSCTRSGPGLLDMLQAFRRPGTHAHWHTCYILHSTFYIHAPACCVCFCAVAYMICRKRVVLRGSSADGSLAAFAWWRRVDAADALTVCSGGVPLGLYEAGGRGGRGRGRARRVERWLRVIDGGVDGLVVCFCRRSWRLSTPRV